MADILQKLTRIKLASKQYAVFTYLAAPDNSVKGMIHGIEPSTQPSELQAHFRAPNYSILHARMLGQTQMAVITFEGTRAPHYVYYYKAETRCLPYRSTRQACTIRLRVGPRADVGPNPETNRYPQCGQASPRADPDCKLTCALYQGDHPTADKTCPARIRKHTRRQGATHYGNEEMRAGISRRSRTSKRSCSGDEQQRCSSTSASRARSKSRRCPSSQSRAHSTSKHHSGSKRMAHSKSGLHSRSRHRFRSRIRSRPGSRSASRSGPGFSSGNRYKSSSRQSMWTRNPDDPQDGGTNVTKMNWAARVHLLSTARKNAYSTHDTTQTSPDTALLLQLVLVEVKALRAENPELRNTNQDLRKALQAKEQDSGLIPEQPIETLSLNIGTQMQINLLCENQALIQQNMSVIQETLTKLYTAVERMLNRQITTSTSNPVRNKMREKPFARPTLNSATSVSQ
ncbi:hypothetical protein HPB48_010389 [Haemaphysalis longicornis]|uniref:Uncharacterized protein n=1 Tax=Haemaphysalis longicornis TaxID=44386 RepID=A0A9J6FTT8_HAELO|nr:hypothetical protein HPB48_010389 [Haemaphysalis longicornis]